MRSPRALLVGALLLLVVVGGATIPFLGIPGFTASREPGGVKGSVQNDDTNAMAVDAISRGAVDATRTVTNTDPVDQVDVIDGQIDVNEDGAVNTADDLADALLAPAAANIDQVDIIDGKIDVNENGTVTTADDRANVLLFGFWIDIVVTDGSVPYQAYQQKVQYNPAVLDYDGHAFVTTPLFICGSLVVDEPGGTVQAGCATMSATNYEGPVETITFHCLVQDGSTSQLHLVTIVEDPTFGTVTASGPGVQITTNTTDAQITCGGAPTPTHTPTVTNTPTPLPVPNAMAVDAVSGGAVNASTTVTGTAPFDVDIVVTDAPNPYVAEQYKLQWNAALLAYDADAPTLLDGLTLCGSATVGANTVYNGCGALAPAGGNKTQPRHPLPRAGLVH